MTKITITKEAMTKIMAMTDADLVLRLRARPFRFGGETEDEAKARRQRDREVAADRIEALIAELCEAEATVTRMAAIARAALKGETT